jgi:hypothetical protein
MNFVYLRSYMSKLFAFCLDSCIVNKGEKFVHVLGTWECLEGVQFGSGNFWVVWCRAVLLGRSNRPQAVSCGAGGLTALWWWSNRSGHVEQIFALYCIPMLLRCIGSGGVSFGSGGACICVGGAICGVRALVRWFALVVWAWFCPNVSIRCPCLRGPRFVFLKWSCSLLFFGFQSLVEVSFYLFLFFFFSLVLLHVDVVNALIKGEIEDNVWFDDRWMVASLCDEWLTTLCGLILG